MPFRLESIAGHQLWLPVCDLCQEPGVPLPGHDVTRDIRPSLEALTDLDNSTVICEECQLLPPVPTWGLDVKGALIEHLLSLPGGRDLDYTPGSTVMTLVDALTLGENEADTHLITIPPNLILELDEDLVGRPAANFLRRAIQNRAQQAQSTTVVMSKTTCELPEWVTVGVWVRRITDDVRARIDCVEHLTVVLAFDDGTITWRRTKNAVFEKAFAQLPPPPTRWERLLQDHDPIVV